MEWLASLLHDQNGSIWFYDTRRHPASAAQAVRHRVCADTFSHVLAWTFSVFVVASSAAFVLLIGDQGGMRDVYIALIALAGANFCLLNTVGEWAMRNGHGAIAYLYLVLIYCIWVAMAWCSAMGVVYIKEAQVRRRLDRRRRGLLGATARSPGGGAAARHRDTVSVPRRRRRQLAGDTALATAPSLAALFDDRRPRVSPVLARVPAGVH